MLAMWLLRLFLVLAIVGFIGWILCSIYKTLYSKTDESEKEASSLRRKIEELEIKRCQLTELAKEVDITNELRKIDAEIAQLRQALSR